MPDDKNISLREFLELKIEHGKEIGELTKELIEKARQIQAIETERRLESLNGEAARITKILESTIPREVHERDIKELAKDIKALTAHKDVGTGKSMTIAAVIMFILGAIGAAGGILSLFK